MMSGHRQVFLTLIILLLLPTVAVAEEEESRCLTRRVATGEVSARSLSLQGLHCFEAQRFDWALSHYRAAYSLSPDTVLHGAIGRSHHELGLFDLARDHYLAFLAVEGQSPAGQRIRNRVGQLQEDELQQGARLRLQAGAPDVNVALILENGYWIELGPAPLELSLREGSYEFAFHKPGYRTTYRQVRLSAQETEEVRLELISEDALFDISERTRKRAGAYTLGASIPITAAGITLLVMASQNRTAALELDQNFTDLSDYDSRRREHLDRADTFQNWGTIGTGVGAAGVVIGALLLSSGSSGSDDQDGENLLNNSHGRSLFPVQPLISHDFLGFQVRF